MTVDLRVISVHMALESMFPNDALKFSRVHREKEWAQNGALGPRVIEVENDASLPYPTEKELSATYDLNHARAQPMKPNKVSSFPKRMS